MKKQAKAGQVVGGLVAAARLAVPDDKPTRDERTGRRLGRTYYIPCGYKGCDSAASEGEAFRLKTAPGSRYKTKLTWFWRCDHHWKQIGFKGDEPTDSKFGERKVARCETRHARK